MSVDHLGSTSVVANTDATQHSRKGYKAFGETRFAAGSLPTRYQFTGQASHETDFGLYFYKARWFDPALSRWASPDTVVPSPGNPLDWDRYQYVRSNSIRYNDPSGHSTECGLGDYGCRAGRYPGTVREAPNDGESRLRKAGNFNQRYGYPDWMIAEYNFMEWIYGSGRYKSSWWVETNGYLLESRFAGEELVGLDISLYQYADSGAVEWAIYLQYPTESNFWAAHNASLRAGVRRADALGFRDQETSVEKIQIDITLNNVFGIGDGCIAGNSMSCLVSNSTILDLATSYTYPQIYPATPNDVLGVPQYDGTFLGIFTTAVTYFWTQLTGCTISSCFSYGP